MVNVPARCNEEVWDVETNKYEIPIDNKEWVLMKVNECWRNRKSKLKHYIYFKYHTQTRIEKRMYLNLCSTYAAQEKSKLGKAAGQAMRLVGRGKRGLLMKPRRKNPDKEITRTDVWLETHAKKDGSYSCEETERVRIIHA